MALLGPPVTVDNFSVAFPTLVAGYSYVAMVTATNSNGGITVDCPSIQPEFGKPVITIVLRI